MPPAIMKNTSLLNEKSTLASWGFILLTISTRMLLTCTLKDIKIGCISIGLPQKKKRLNYTAEQLKTCH
jgi:hypothetical protein